MQTETLDICVRNYLANKQYPLHYYLPVLHRAITGINEISKDFNFGTNIKTVEKTISVDRTTYPDDCNNILKVFGIVAGKEKSFAYNPWVTTVKKMNGATHVVYTDSDTTLTGNETERNNIVKEATMAGELPQMNYINYVTHKYEYNIDYSTKEIILKPNSEVTKIYIRYKTNLATLSNTTNIPLVAESAVHAYIEWQFAKNSGASKSRIADINTTETLKEEYYTAKRNLRSELNPATIDDYLQIITS